MAVSDTWEWYCGVNSTDIEDSQSLTKENVLGSPCLVDGLDTLAHLVFVICALLLLLVFKCTHYNNGDTKFLLRFPGHELRCIFLIASLILLAGSIGEGILTDATYDSPTQPHLYLPQCGAILGTIAAMACYQHMEMWLQAGYILWVVLLYWICAFTTQTVRLLNLQYLDLGSVEIARFDFTLALMVVYGVLILLDINAIRSKVCHCCQAPEDQEAASDMKLKNMRYIRRFANLLSELTFWWLNWLPILGYKRPIVVEDLGKIPHRHQAREIHEKFKIAYQKEKARAEKTGSQPSLWRVYRHVHGVNMLISYSLKLTADTLSYVGPLALDPIVQYVTRIVYGNEEVGYW
ncbi:ATP-binding cassette sub-family C member 9-like [Amphiura filiformis]|uniref:ATP-binding cassette sub-family C member 9-like n=1 Tax=Amphiura filiformis TaxID=82378 RepID=UPI003B2226C2